MKQLILRNPGYQYLEKSFAEWLSVTGYAEPSVSSLPVHIRELFHYLEERHIKDISVVLPRHITGFVNHLKQRTNQTYGGGLSSAYINKSIHAISTFGSYLAKSGKYAIDWSHRGLPSDSAAPSILSRDEILQLYDSTFDPYERNSIATGQRDRVIIAILYGCGLRSMEARNLNLYDIDLNRSRLFVRKGKGNKQRYVPIARKSLEDIKAWIVEGRNWFMEDHYQGHYQHLRYGTPHQKKEDVDEEAFFLNQHGSRMKDFCYRLKQMKERAGIDKDFSPHDLRHSIAPHLLESGMDLDEIKKFLGHSSLVSTQIYTRITEEQQFSEPLN
jgi:integrase/recombinase XerD